MLVSGTRSAAHHTNTTKSTNNITPANTYSRKNSTFAQKPGGGLPPVLRGGAARIGGGGGGGCVDGVGVLEPVGRGFRAYDKSRLILMTKR